MFKFNLLPPQEKKELELVKFCRLLIFLSFRLIAVLIIFILILATTYLFLSILVKAQSDLIELRQNNEKTKHQVEVEDNIRQINQGAKKVLVKQDESIIWTPILEKISEITPSGIYLIDFSYRASNDQINIVGWARNRDKLLTFENSLKQTPYFKEIESPLSNLIKQTDINFSFILKPAL